MARPRTTRMTPALDRLLTAINRTPQPTLRNLCEATDTNSTSVIKYRLEQLAEMEKIVLVENARGLTIETGKDFCAAWNAAARLAGNPDA